MTLSAMVSPWFALPAAGVVMLILASHIEATRAATRPESRRRIRVANGWVMLLMVPMAASGFSVLDPETNRRGFVLVWLGVVWLLSLSLLLAMVDVSNTLRLTMRDRRKLKGELHDITRDIARLRSESGEPRKGATGADDRTSS